MSAAAVLTLVATVVQTDGARLTIDKGLLDGLRAGDQGAVYYQLAVRDESRRIEVGEARVATVDDRSAELDGPTDATVWPDFLVEFRLPPNRVAPDEIQLALAGRRLAQGRLDEAAESLESWDRLQEIVGTEGAGGRQRTAAVDLHQRLARLRLEAGESGRAERHLLAVQRLEPGEPASLALVRRVKATQAAEMVRIPAGEYKLGADGSDASFYNQRPAFRKRLDPFLLDSRPVSRETFLLFQPDFVFAAGVATAATGVSWAEAEEFCRWRQKRLPTEFEWEVAARRSAVDVSTPLWEWTASWYLPYPGNNVPEESYGQTSRVLRGRGDGDGFDARIRRFLDPELRHSRVGFRCASDDGGG